MSSTTAVYPRQVPSEHEAQDVVSINTKPPQDTVERRNKNYGKIPKAVLTKGLTPLQFAVYAYLSCCAGPNAVAKPRIIKIGEAVGSAKSAVQKALSQLVDMKLVEKTTIGRGKRHSKLSFKLPLHHKLPFGRVNMDHVTNRDLRPALALLSALSMHANEDGIAWPAQTDLIKTLGIKRTALHSQLKTLRDGGWVQTERVDGSMIYYVLHHVRLRRPQCSPQEAPECSPEEAQYNTKNNSLPEHVPDQCRGSAAPTARTARDTMPADVSLARDVMFDFLSHLNSQGLLEASFCEETAWLAGEPLNRLTLFIEEEGLEAYVSALRAMNVEWHHIIEDGAFDPNIHNLTHLETLHRLYGKFLSRADHHGWVASSDMPDWDADWQAEEEREYKSSFDLPGKALGFPKVLADLFWPETQTRALTDGCGMDTIEAEEADFKVIPIEPPRAWPVFHLYDEPAGPFKPLTDIEQAKDTLYDLMRVPQLTRLSLVGLTKAELESQLQAKLDVVGLAGWLEDVKRIVSDPEPHKHITVADLLAA